jgi:hypothetical protein
MRDDVDLSSKMHLAFATGEVAPLLPHNLFRS